MTNLAVLQQGTNADILTNIIGNLFVAQTPEVFKYEADGKSDQQRALELLVEC